MIRHLDASSPYRARFILIVKSCAALFLALALTACTLSSPVTNPDNSGSGGSGMGSGASTATPAPVAGASQSADAAKRLSDDKPSKTAIREFWALDTRVCCYWFDQVKPGTVDAAKVRVAVDGQPAEVAEVRLDQYGLTATLAQRTWHGQRVSVTLDAPVETEKNGPADALADREAVNRNAPPWRTQALIGPELGDGSRLQSIGGLAMAADQTFYVTDPKAGRIVHLDRTGAVLSSWTAESPEGIAVLQSGQLYVTCGPQNRIDVLTPEGTRLYSVGRALKGNETPEAFINSSNFTEGRNMGGFRYPFRLSGSPDAVQMAVLDRNCFVQMYMEPIDNPAEAPGDRMTYRFDAGNLVQAGPTLGEDAAGANVAFGGEHGIWLMKEAAGLLKTVAVVELKTVQGGSPVPAGLPSMEAFQPTDMCRDGEYAMITDAGNHRVLSFKAASGQDAAVFGNEGTGAEQFLHPAFIRSFGGTTVVADDRALMLHVYARAPSALSMSCVEPYHIGAMAADPYLMFDEKNAKAQEKGVVYATHEYPTLSDTAVAVDAAFTEGRVAIRNLEPGTRYYARAYALVEGDAVYSYQAGFTTKP